MEHLTNHVDDTPETDVAITVQSMAAYAEALDKETAELKVMEDAMKIKKAKINKLKQESLPNIMNELGMSSFTLKNGSNVTVKEDVSCTVMDYDKLYTFLEERGDDALIKTSIETGKLPKSILAAIIKLIFTTFKVEATGGLKIHTTTLNAYFRRLIGLGPNGKCEIPIAQIDESMVKIFSFYKTTIEK